MGWDASRHSYLSCDILLCHRCNEILFSFFEAFVLAMVLHNRARIAGQATNRKHTSISHSTRTTRALIMIGLSKYCDATFSLIVFPAPCGPASSSMLFAGGTAAAATDSTIGLTCSEIAQIRFASPCCTYK